MNGLKKFFGKNDIEVFESGRKSAEQAKQKARKPKSSRWKKYLAVGASMAILTFATPLNSGESSTLSSPDNIKDNNIEFVSEKTKTDDYYTKIKEMEKISSKTKEGRKLQAKLSSAITTEKGEIQTTSGEIREKNFSDMAVEYICIASLATPYFYKDSALSDDVGHELLKFALSKNLKIKMHFLDNGEESFGAKLEYLPELDKKGKPKLKNGKPVINPVITFSWPKDFKYPDKIQEGKEVYDYLPNEVYSYAMMRSFGHEMRHLWQTESGMPQVVNTEHIHDQIMKKRIREADASAIETLITWQMKQKFKNSRPYDYYSQDKVKKDIASKFKYIKQKGFNDEIATYQAFVTWYGNENRNRPYDEQIVDNWVYAENDTPDFKPATWIKKLVLPVTGEEYVQNKFGSVGTEKMLKKPKYFGVSEDIKKRMEEEEMPGWKDFPIYPEPSSKTNTMNFDKHADKTKQQTAFNRNKKDSKTIAAVIRKQKLHKRG